MLRRCHKFNTTKETIKTWGPLLQILYVQWKANCLQLLLIGEGWINAIAEHKMREYNQKNKINIPVTESELKKPIKHMQRSTPEKWNSFTVNIKLFTGKCRNQLKHSSPPRHLVSPVCTPCFTKLVTAAKTMFPWLQSVSKVFTCPAVGAHLWSLTLGCRVRSLIEVCAGGKCCCHQPVDRAAKNGKFHRELGSSYSGAKCPTIKYPFWQYPVVRTAVLPMSKSKRKSWHWQENEDTKQEIKCTSFAFGVWLFFSLSMVQIFKLCSVSTKTWSVFYFVPKLRFMAHSTIGNACLEESIQPQCVLQSDCNMGWTTSLWWRRQNKTMLLLLRMCRLMNWYVWI